MKDKIRAFTSIIKKLAYILDDRQKKKSIGVLFVIIVGAAFETLGISALLPFIQGLVNLDGLKDKWYAVIISNITGINDSFAILVTLGIFIILIYLFKNLYLIFSAKVQTKFRCDIIKELSIKIFNSYMRRPYSFYLDINSAEFMRGINDDVVGVFFVLDELFRMIKSFATVFFIGIYIISTDIMLAGGILVLSGACIILIQFLFGNKIKELRVILRQANKEQYQAAYQAVSGIKDIKVMRRGEYFIKQYEMAYEKKAKADYGYCVINEVPKRMIELACVFGLIVTLCIRIKLGADMEEFVPQLATFAVAIFQMMPLIGGIASNLNGLAYKSVSLDATYRNLWEVSQYENEQGEEYCEKKIGHVFSQNLEIRNVSWKYSKEGSVVLKNASIRINKGESIALIGASGAGKTTMADVILGLLCPQEGHILVDGIDVYSIPQTWSEMVGYVPQTVFLLDDTIKNNIIFGKENEDADDEKVWEALEEAQLKEFVMNLPLKLNTNVGERGVKFSGGQRQRIAIARALYYNPSILVLDEATSALDNETEKAVMEAIERLHGNKTLIIIAHRLSTIKHCDRIYEIANGVAIEKNKDEICRDI